MMNLAPSHHLAVRAARAAGLLLAALVCLGPGCDDADPTLQDAGVALDGQGDAGSDSAPPDAAQPDASGSIAAKVISGVSGALFEAETHVVAAPSGRLLAVWMGVMTTSVANGYAFSEDGGATWTAPQTAGAPAKGDPVATVGKDGSFYYGYLDGTCSGGVCSGGHVYVARSPAGKTTFDPPVDVSPADPQEFYDKPWMMTGRDGTLLVVVAARRGAYPTNEDRIIAARSTDSGKTWSTTEVLPRQAKGQIAGIPHACISSTSDRVWVLHVETQTSTGASIRWSDDLGATWPAANQSSAFARAADAAKLQSYDLRCVGRGDSVWVMYGLGVGSGSSTAIPLLGELRIARSSDGGKTWPAEATIKQAGLGLLRPEIALEPAGGLDVIAYTGATEGDTKGAVRWWRSSDGGKSFVEQAVLHQPLTFTGDRAVKAWIGDYSGLTIDRGALVSTFVDNASGRSRIMFTRQALP